MLSALVLAAALAAPAAPDPLATKNAAEGWIWAERAWAPPAEAKDLVGGRFQALLGFGKDARWGAAIRADVSGLPSTFDVSKVQTYRAVQAMVAVHRNLYATSGIQFGLAAGIGGAVPLVVEDGARPKLKHDFMGGAGIRAAAPGWWVYATVGQHPAIRGLAGILVYQLRTSERTAAVGTFAVGGRSSYAQIGVAVRWF